MRLDSRTTHAKAVDTKVYHKQTLAMFEVVYKKRAIKTLARIPAPLRERIRVALGTLAADPDMQLLDTKPLQGRHGFRLRIGDWRVLYEIDRGRLIILVIQIGPRGDV